MLQKGMGTPKPSQNILSQSMKINKEAVSGKKKLIEAIEENKNAPSASSDNQS